MYFGEVVVLNKQMNKYGRQKYPLKNKRRPKITAETVQEASRGHSTKGSVTMLFAPFSG